MEHPKKILENYAAETGWTNLSMLEIICEYLYLRGNCQDFEDYVHQIVEEEKRH